MNSNKLLTIVIPTYNIEKYIEKCLASFLNKKIINYLDIIVVNDGSKDNSLLKASNIAKKYPKSITIVDKENAGHGSTINVGVNKSTGKYFMVVDGDDWIDSNALENIIGLLKEEKYDAIFVNSIIEMQYKNTTRKRNLKAIFKNTGDVDLNSAMPSIDNQVGLANIIYKTSILKDINLKLLEKTFYVDVEYMLYPLRKINSAFYCDEYIYHYLVGRPEQSINISTALKHLNDRKKVIKAVVNYYSNLDLKKSSKYILRTYYSKLASVINDYYDILIRGNANYEKEINEMNNFIISKDKRLYDYVEKKYYYIKKARVSNYSKKAIKINFVIDRYLKKIRRVIKRGY